MTAPLVAIIANVLTPYRLHVHRRIARELPDIRLASLFTHDQPDQPWDLPDLPEINPVRFGGGDPVTNQLSLRYAAREWAKGGRIIRWLKENRAAAVLIGGYNDAGRLRIIRWAHRARLPLFMFADSNIEGDLATGLRRTVKKMVVPRIVRACTGVMPCGTLGERYFQRYGARPDQIFYWPYEPDYDLIAHLTKDQIARTLADLALDPARQRIVVCSRLVPHKRVGLALDAFQRIAPDRPEFDLILIGDGPERAALQAAVSPTLRTRVKFTGFIGDQAQIAAIYRASHVLAHPSDYEPWGVVINEAVCAGMAVVASAITGAAADLVRDRVNGFVFRPGDPDALAAALAKATDPALLPCLRAGSGPVLAEWRRRADPVGQLRRALAWAGVLGPEAPHHAPAGVVPAWLSR